jgi:hypothetical protein
MGVSAPRGETAVELHAGGASPARITHTRRPRDPRAPGSCWVSAVRQSEGERRRGPVIAFPLNATAAQLDESWAPPPCFPIFARAITAAGSTGRVNHWEDRRARPGGETPPARTHFAFIRKF